VLESEPAFQRQGEIMSPKHIYYAAGIVVAALFGVFVIKPMIDASLDSSYSAYELAAFEWCNENRYERVIRWSEESRRACLVVYKMRHL
jgi:hypothetical protein